MDAQRIWTLNAKQTLMFGLIADVLRRERDGERVDAQHLLLTGKPGTGKSRVLQAVQWFALQIDAVEMIAVVAYTWRAALLLGTPDNPACTTTTFFAIDSFSDRSAHKLRGAGKVRIALRMIALACCVRTRRLFLQL